METVPRIHVEKLPATIEQQYQKNKRFGGRRRGRVSQGSETQQRADHNKQQQLEKHQSNGQDRERWRRGGRRRGRSRGQGAERKLSQRLEAGHKVLLLRGRQAG